MTSLLRSRKLYTSEERRSQLWRTRDDIYVNSIDIMVDRVNRENKSALKNSPEQEGIILRSLVVIQR